MGKLLSPAPLLSVTPNPGPEAYASETMGTQAHKENVLSNHQPGGADIF